MRPAPQKFLPVSCVLLLGLAACGTSSLRRSQVDVPDLANLRSEYIEQYPDSPFLDNVNHGEIVRGMDAFCVLACWGPPGHRARDGGDFERWLYVDLDDVLNEQVGYALEFEAGVLKSWDIHRAGVGIKTRDFSEQPPSAVPAVPAGKPLPND